MLNWRMAFYLGHTSSVVDEKKRTTRFSSIYQSLKKVLFNYGYRRLAKALHFDCLRIPPALSTHMPSTQAHIPTRILAQGWKDLGSSDLLEAKLGLRSTLRVRSLLLFYVTSCFYQEILLI